MNFDEEKDLGRWLVTKAGVEKLLVQKCLGLIKKAQSQGKSTPPMLQILVKNGKLEAEQAKELMKGYRLFVASREEVTSKSENGGERKGAALVEEGAAQVEPEPQIGAEEAVEEAPIEVSDEGSEAKPADEMERDAKSQVEEESSELEQQPLSESEPEQEPEPAPQTKASAKCPECQSEVDPGDQVCRTCGASLLKPEWLPCSFCDALNEADAKVCHHCFSHPQTGAPTKRTKRCQSCKSPLRPDDALCLKCGAPVASSASSSLAHIGLMVAGLQVLGLCLTLFFWNSNDKEQIVVVPVKDPYGKVLPRSLDPELLTAEMSDEEKSKLKEAMVLVRDRDWGQLSRALASSSWEESLAEVYLSSLVHYHKGEGESLLANHLALTSHKGLGALSEALRLKQSMAFCQDFDFELGWKVLEPLLGRDDLSPLSCFWAGTLLYENGDHLEARSWFEKAAEKDSSLPQAHLFLYLLKKQREPVVAKQHLDAFKEVYTDEKSVERLLRMSRGGV